jgi:hypothetical protein
VSALLPAVITFAVACLWVMLAWWLDRHGSEPLPRMGGMMVLGCGVGAAWVWVGSAVCLALWPPAGTGLDDPAALVRATLVLAAAGALVGVLLLVVGRGCPTDGPSSGAMAGLVSGAAVALGRAAGVPLLDLAGVTAPRPLVEALLLAYVGAWVGLGIGFARLSLRWPVRVARMAGALAISVAGGLAVNAVLGCDAVTEGKAWWAAAIAVGVGLLAVLAVPAGFALEGRIIARQLAEEVAYGVLTTDLATVAVSPLRRMRRGWWQRRDERRAVSRLLVDLAFWKQRLVGLDEVRTRVFGLEVGRLRQRLRRLLSADGVVPGGGA